MTKPIYFFHIPSTGGRFFHANTANLIRYPLQKRGEIASSILKCHNHMAVPSELPEDSLSYCIIREPVSRTVSHYIHLYFKACGWVESDKKKIFLDYLESNPNDSLINYQTKFLSLRDVDVVDIYDRTLPNVSNAAAAIDALGKVDFVIRNSSLSYELTKRERARMAAHLGIQDLYPDAEISVPRSVNVQSKILFESLTPFEINYVEGLMALDMELYSTRGVA
jgi:hypothetical protein